MSETKCLFCHTEKAGDIYTSMEVIHNLATVALSDKGLMCKRAIRALEQIQAEAARYRPSAVTPEEKTR